MSAKSLPNSLKSRGINPEEIFRESEPGEVRKILTTLTASFNYDMPKKHLDVWVDELSKTTKLSKLVEAARRCRKEFVPSFGKKFPTLPELLNESKKETRWPKWVTYCAEKWKWKPKLIYTNFAKWQCEYAIKLGITPDKLPAHGKDLTPEQRKILNIPEPEDYEGMVKDLVNILAGKMTRSQYKQKWGA